MANNKNLNIFDVDLPRRAANYQPLTPIDFLRWSSDVYGDRRAVVYEEKSLTYRQFHQRCHRLAAALGKVGVGRGDTVSIMSPNTPAMLEAHYGVPMSGAVLNALNFRLDAETISFILEHCEAKVLITDSAFAPVIGDALANLSKPITVIDIVDPHEVGECLGTITYEDFLQTGDLATPLPGVQDEWDAISLCYTSGTTGNPKGVVYHHRGAYLNALSNAFVFGLNANSVYLWTLPMFHCNGWTCTWAVTAAGATHICLRKIEADRVFDLVQKQSITHFCGAPVVLNMLAHAPEDARRTFRQNVDVLTGGAAPPSAVIQSMEAMGFRVRHLYGLTETYGPSMVCAEQTHWQQLSDVENAKLRARQGVRYPTIEALDVIDSETGRSVASDASAMGEIAIRGNTVMKGYLKNPEATDKALGGNWFRSGDLAVRHDDGYVEVKDRSKDVIISGGENISSLEIEEVLYRHPDIMEAAVVAKPDDHWGETPCAFVTPGSTGRNLGTHDVVEWCRQHLAGFKVPRHVVFGPLPKTSTGKIMKFELRERARSDIGAG